MFDLDGTLVDGYDGITIGVNAARAALGLPPWSRNRVVASVGHGLENLMAKATGEANAAEAAERFREAYAKVYLATTRAFPGVAEALDELARRGIRMTVASNKPAAFCAPILDRVGLLSRLDAVEGPETAGATKPHPAMLHRCCAAMRLDPSNCAYVGDMDLDVRTAASAGLPVVLVATGSTPRDRLEATGERVLDSVAELPSLPLATPPDRSADRSLTRKTPRV